MLDRKTHGAHIALFVLAIAHSVRIMEDMNRTVAPSLQSLGASLHPVTITASNTEPLAALLPC